MSYWSRYAEAVSLFMAFAGGGFLIAKVGQWEDGGIIGQWLDSRRTRKRQRKIVAWARKIEQATKGHIVWER